MKRRIRTLAVCAAVAAAALTAPLTGTRAPQSAVTAQALSFADFPSQYQYAADWIWENRIMNEDSLGMKSKRWNTLFDQIIANKGQLNYVVRWHSMQTVTYEQRKAFESMVDTGINKWADILVGYENWPYEHVKVNIVGWAVLDKSVMQDLHSDEVVWDNITEQEGDSSLVSKGVPAQIPCAPAELWTFNYFGDRSHQYPGQSFDMYIWATQNYGDYGGCGGDWGQRLSDNYYLAASSGSGFPHIYWHELGHGFGMTDFYGGEGESDGFPPGGFPGNGTSIMMAGSSSEITDFDAWMLRYMWTKAAAQDGRFDLANAVDPSTVTTAAPAETTTTPTTTQTTAPADTGSGEAVTTVTQPAGENDAVYYPENDYWLLNIPAGVTKFRVRAYGLPWAALSGIRGYWDNIGQSWEQAEYSFANSLGEQGSDTFEVEIPAGQSANQLQIQVTYYAQWSNDAQDMVAQDKTALRFAIEYDEAGTTVTETTAADTEPAATTTVSDVSEPIAEAGLRGDVDCSGDVNVADAVLLARFCAEDSGITVSAQGKLNANVSGDSDITTDDLGQILEYLAGIRTAL